MKSSIISTYLIITSSLVTARIVRILRPLAYQHELYDENFDKDVQEFFTKDDLAEIYAKESCVQYQMNFEGLKDKKLEPIKLKILILSASALCLTDQEKFFKSLAENLYKIANSFDNIEYMECLQLEFKKIQPSSRILRNFTYELTDEDIKFCEKAPEIKEIEDVIDRFQIKYCRFYEMSCGALSTRKAYELAVNLIVLRTVEDDEEVTYELERLGHVFREKVMNILECMKISLDNYLKPVYMK
ncbi:hypothetical protein ACKWTF_014809 [Chironomus riparius]